MEKVLLCYQNKRGQNTRDKMPKHQTERQTTDMTERQRGENKRRGKRGFQFLSAFCLFSLSFFSFFFFFQLFSKRTNFFFQRFFLKGGFVQITCAISLHLGARALSSDDTLPERERER